MKISLINLLQLSKDYNQIWPSDLANDLEEEEPQVLQQKQIYESLIRQHLRTEEKSDPTPVPLIKTKPRLSTLVVPGWNNQNIKGTKNWPDFENLLLFYAIGELDRTTHLENQEQKEWDKEDLRKAIEDFLPLKGQKKKAAEERIAVNTTYLAFGKNVIDGLVRNNPSTLYEAQREIQDACETNYYNAQKLEKSYSIAHRVFKHLKNRYR